jgi:O-Antigen ligase
MRAADRAQAWFEAGIAGFGLGIDPMVLALTLGAAVLALTLWVAWRWPALTVALALAALAIRPQLLWGDRNVGYEWGLHQTLLLAALAVNALHFGLRKSINWPIVALTAVFALNLLFGQLHEDLTIGLMLTGLSLLALPFVFTQVSLGPNSRRLCTLLIALTPLLSVAIGALIQVAGVHTMFAGVHDRLEGATGNAGVFGALAFAGFAVALHEAAVRPQGRSSMGALASVNLVLVILSGTRTSMLASAVLLLAYLLTSEQFRDRLRRNRATVVFGICLIGAAVTVYAPTLYNRVLDSMGRAGIWERFYDEFWRSPVFGRGLGSAFITRKASELLYAAPHNEYLHLLVVGGAVGFALCLTAIVFWYADILRTASHGDRKFLLPLAAALAVYAIADNILVYPTALGLFVYLGLIGQPEGASSALRTVIGTGPATSTQGSPGQGAERGVAAGRRWTLAPPPALTRDRSRHASHT